MNLIALRSFSRLTAFEAARILTKIGADVRVYNPSGLPLKDDASEKHEKVLELRSLSEWSDGHLWCSPEQHGAITGVFKTQSTSKLTPPTSITTKLTRFIHLVTVDWIPLSVGSVRPTQGRTLAVVQVNGGSQSFNVVNTLRLLGRWMRMFTVRFPLLVLSDVPGLTSLAFRRSLINPLSPWHGNASLPPTGSSLPQIEID